LTFPLWAQALFDGIVSRPSIRYFLNKSFTTQVDEAMVEHAYRSAHQHGARFAPLAFLSGELFSRDAVELLYQQVTVPSVVVYDRDAYSSFIRLPEFVSGQLGSGQVGSGQPTSGHDATWSAVRIPDTLGMPHWDEPAPTLAVLVDHWSSADR
jgi:hypothetical protein